MSFESLLEEVRARDNEPIAPADQNAPRRAKSIWKTSVEQKITTDEADSQILVGDIIDDSKRLENSPLYQDADNLLDALEPIELPSIADPSEPPDIEGTAGNDPMAELLRFELESTANLTKGFLKGMAFIFSPIERAFKFGTNALMFDPLSKSAAGPTKRVAMFVAIEAEKNRQIRELEKERGISFDIFADPTVARPQLPREDIDRITRQVNKDAVGLIRKMNSEIEELDPVTIGDFGNSIKDAAKAVVPWPGFADDVKSAGEISAGSFKRITGRDAPWYYAPVADTVLETVAIGGLLKVSAASQSGKDAASIARAAKLTKRERQAIKKLRRKVLTEKRLTKAGKQKKKQVTIMSGKTIPTVEEAAILKEKFISLVKEGKSFKKGKAQLKFESEQRKLQRVEKLKGNIKGDFSTGTVREIRPTPNAGLDRVEISALFDLVANTPGTERSRAIRDMVSLAAGTIPNKKGIANLELVFGRDLSKALLSKRSLATKGVDLGADLIQLPRAVLASYDLSAPARQGIIFSVSHPVASMKAYSRSIRAVRSAQYADDIDRVSKNSKFGKMALEHGVHRSPIGESARVLAKEEAYMSNLADKIPGIEQSGRGFTVFLNEQRKEVFAVQAKKWISRGITPENDPLSFEQYAKFINHATGRGSLDGLPPAVLKGMNAAFFSPRLQVSRVQIGLDLVSPATTLNARKVIARDLAEFYATGMGVMAMAKAGGAEVELDPRSSDFGKIQVGNTRYNYWGPLQPMAVFTARIVSGQTKTIGTGKVRSKARVATMESFVRSKLSPIASLVVDPIKGETVMGETVELTPEFITKTAIRNLVPLIAQDVFDAWSFQELDMQLPITAGLAFTGIGVGTWELSKFAELELAKDSLARQTYGRDYNELTFPEVQVLDADILINHPGLVELEREAKFDINSASLHSRIANEARVSEITLNKRLDRNLREALDAVKLRTGGVSRVVGSWRLNDEQYEEYQERIADNVNKLFAEHSDLWKASGTESRFEIMSSLLLSARRFAAMDMKIGEVE